MILITGATGRTRSHAAKELAARGVAKDHRVSRGGGFTGSLRIQIQSNVVNFFLIQELGQVLATPPIAADDEVLVCADRLAGDAVNLQAAAQEL